MKASILLLLLFAGLRASGQVYEDDIRRWQRHYKEEFLTDPRSPVKVQDTGYIHFFRISEKWRVRTQVILTPDAAAFKMSTHSGKLKQYRPYARFCFVNPVSRGPFYDTLTAYERVDPPPGDTISSAMLFLPFNDLTNGRETYGGGRYIDLMKADVKATGFLLDFNKAYNPYCAFGEGFSCPIPPSENHLKMYVRAGEMNWTKKAKE